MSRSLPCTSGPRGYHFATMRERWIGRDVPGRLPGLLAGLVVFGAGIAVMAAAGLGLGPWEAFHQGLSRLSGLALGTVGILVGIPVLAAWLPLRERPGLGTALNVVLIGIATNVTLPLLPRPDLPVIQLAMSAAGVVLIAIGSGLYLAADLGPGPRDGLMTGLHRRCGWSIRRARTTLELGVLAAGFVLGGSIGVGTLLFAFGIGPLVQLALGAIDRSRRGGGRRPDLLSALEAPARVGE